MWVTVTASSIGVKPLPGAIYAHCGSSEEGINQHLAGKSPVATDGPINPGCMPWAPTLLFDAGKAQWCNVYKL
jgi:hypothetical protein